MKLKTLLLIPILFAAYLAIIAIGGIILGSQPDTVNAAYHDSLVYADEQGLLIVFARAPMPVYRLDPTDRSGLGCYRLTPPQPGEKLGYATQVWPMCWKEKK